jgi:putative peptidoglycan lipid II flippase
MAKGFETHARTVTLLTLVSRVTGFARDAVLARVFGAGAIMDAFNFAFTVPNLFRRLFGEGALTASFLPVYTRLVQEKPQAAQQFGGLMVGLLALFLSGVTLLGELVLWWLHDADANSALGTHLLMIMLPYMPLVCLVALLGAVLQVHGRFGPTAAAPIILNIAITAAAFYGSHYALNLGVSQHIEPRTHIVMVAWSVIAAGLMQVAWSWWAMRRSGLRVHFDVRTSREHLIEVMRKALPMLLGLGIFQINTFVDGLVASYQTMVGPTVFGIDYPLPVGAMTELAYGQRLYEFPLGVFGISLATAIFPALARQTKDMPAFLETLRRGLRLTMFIGLPASVGLVLVRNDLAAAVFQGGKFTHQDSQNVGFVLAMYAPAIWAYSMQQVVTRAFYALGDSVTPVKVSVWMVVLNFVLNVVLIWTPLGVGGLALSTAIAATLQIIILQRILARRIGVVIHAPLRMSWARTAVATLIMGGAVWGVSLALPDTPTWWWSVVRLSVLCAVGAAAYYGAARAMRMPELTQIR